MQDKGNHAMIRSGGGAFGSSGWSTPAARISLPFPEPKDPPQSPTSGTPKSSFFATTHLHDSLRNRGTNANRNEHRSMTQNDKETEAVTLTLNECMLLFKIVDKQGLELARAGWRYDDSVTEFVNNLRVKLSDVISRFQDRGISPRSDD